jgi:Holliday junction resolvase
MIQPASDLAYFLSVLRIVAFCKFIDLFSECRNKDEKQLYLQSAKRKARQIMQFAFQSHSRHVLHPSATSLQR